MGTSTCFLVLADAHFVDQMKLSYLAELVIVLMCIFSCS